MRVWFSNGESRTIDFGGYIKASRNPLVRQFADTERFAREMTVDGGVLTWNNDMDFAPEKLYDDTANELRYINSSSHEN